MTRVELVYNHGFPWHSKEGCHVKGFVHTHENQFLSGESLIEYFLRANDFLGLIRLVTEADGMFSVILLRDNKAFMASDRIGTFPLFYAVSGQEKILSDSMDKIQEIKGDWKLNQPAVSEFQATGYVTGRETLSEDVFQVQAGEAVLFEPDQIQQRFYTTYQTSQLNHHSFDDLLKRMGGMSRKVFKRLVGSLQGRTAVIALSGGYDSRFIAVLLKHSGYRKVICFTYGREGNPDMIVSEIVADRLGFQWIPVVYTDKMVEGYMKDDAFYDYVHFTSNGVSMFFMQEYFAIRYLKERQLIPEDSVFIPGHSADFFAGSQFIKHGIRAGDESTKEISKRIWDIKYNLCRPQHNTRKVMMSRICKTLVEKRYIEDARSWSVYEDWDLKEKLSKFIVNSCNIYAWFGYEYRLPFYDVAFQEFFRDVPYEFKLNKKLYDTFLVEGLFKEYNLNQETEIQPDVRIQRMAELKRKLKTLIPDALLPSSPSKQDPIFYYEITRILQEDLAKKGIRINIHGKSYNSLIVQWYIEYLKGLQY